jgi:phosphoribosylamine--glycine ligase
MNILLLGGGGREHALAWKLAQSPNCTKLFASPGNPGIADHAELVALDLPDHAVVVAFCKNHAVTLVVVGPEAPLVDGIADSLRAAGIAVFGPSKAAAQLEGSKGFTKDMCTTANIPTAAYARFFDEADAVAGLAAFGLPVVIKADGLAAGKGVVIATTDAEAHAALADMFSGGFGGAGASVVVEEFLTGEEVSLFALTDGKTVIPFGTAQDHKRIGEGDTGPNTGGMGAYSPATALTPALQERAMDEIVRPTVAAMAAAGVPFVGVLYAGLMLTPDGPKLIEYNARFGDPETQVLMPRFDGDLALLFDAVARGQLASVQSIAFSAEPACTVVLAAPNYPDTPVTGGRITGIESANRIAKVFLAGTNVDGATLIASGGRVLAVTGTGRSFNDARANAYAGMTCINYPDGYFRRDIGWREVERGTM